MSKGYLANRLNEIEEEYAQMRKFETQNADSYSPPSIYGKNSGDSMDVFECRFKDDCYAFRTGSGTCPCALRG